MTTRFTTCCVLLLGSVRLASAHEGEEFDVYLARPTAGTQTVSGGINVDGIDSEIFPGLRVFGTEMGENPLDGVYFGDEPGFNNQGAAGPQAPGAGPMLPGDTPLVTVAPIAVGGFIDTLFFWDGLGEPAFAPAVGALFSIGDPSSAADASGAFDDHPLLTLDDGDGLAGTFPTPGVYLASFTASLPGLEPTEPMMLVMGTEGLITADFLGLTPGEFDLLDDAEIDEALEEVIETGVDYVQTSVVPEPAAALLAMLAVTPAALRRRS